MTAGEREELANELEREAERLYDGGAATVTTIGVLERAAHALRERVPASQTFELNEQEIAYIRSQRLLQAVKEHRARLNTSLRVAHDRVMAFAKQEGIR